MHRLHYFQFSKAIMAYFKLIEKMGDYTYYPATVGQYFVGHNAHEAYFTAAVHEPAIISCQQTAQFLRRIGKGRIVSDRRTAENTYGYHPLILRYVIEEFGERQCDELEQEAIIVVKLIRPVRVIRT
jgi:hypothetical protein